MVPHDVPTYPLTTRLLRMPDVCALTGLSRTRLYALLASGDFPLPVRLHGRAVAFRSDEIEVWIDGRPRVMRLKNNNAPAVAAEASSGSR